MTAAVATIQKADLATMPLEAALEAYTPNFEAALPEGVKVDHFKRMVLTALSVNPDLAHADRRTLFNACVRCASDGLLPDGREASLVVYNTKVKDRDGRERYVSAVQYLPMVAGIRKRMRNSGEVLSATAEVVCKNDKFRYLRGDNPSIEHEPPPLDMDRGPEIGAYSIIKLKNGDILRDVMSKADIERARKQSKAPNSLMWQHFWGEGAKKTVLRRCAKGAPQSATMDRLLNRDEEAVELPPAESLPLVPPRPQRLQFQDAPEGEGIADQGEVVDQGSVGGPLDEQLDNAVDRAAGHDPETGEVRGEATQGSPAQETGPGAAKAAPQAEAAQEPSRDARMAAWGTNATEAVRAAATQADLTEAEGRVMAGIDAYRAWDAVKAKALETTIDEARKELAQKTAANGKKR